MAAISIQVTPQGIRSVIVEQELVFFIGPSPHNPLRSVTDYDRRVEDVLPFLAETGARHAEFQAAVAAALGVPIKHLETSLRSGGKHGVICPNLCLDLVASEAADGTPLFHLSSPRNGAALCRALIHLLDADWVDVWWIGTLGIAQITCERAGRVVCFKGNGKTEEL